MIVFLDIETGGLNLSHPIIQIASVALDDKWTEEETFERKISFRIEDCDPDALRKNSFNEEVWAREAKSPEKVAREFQEFLNRYRSVECMSKRTGRPYKVTRVGGHNVSFDLERLTLLFKRFQLFLPIHYNSILDTLPGSIWYFEKQQAEKPPDRKLVSLARFFGLNVDRAHDALVDVRLSAGVAKKILGVGDGTGKNRP
jgi:DNA polymerase III epsilon subunit-like protein